MEVLLVVVSVIVLLAVAVKVRERRRRLGDNALMSIRDHDWERRAYGDGSQGMPPPQDDANRFGPGAGGSV